MNKQGKAPWLRRSNNVHVKLVNLYRSVGLKVQMDYLSNIENMMINFN